MQRYRIVTTVYCSGRRTCSLLRPKPHHQMTTSCFARQMAWPLPGLKRSLETHRCNVHQQFRQTAQTSVAAPQYKPLESLGLTDGLDQHQNILAGRDQAPPPVIVEELADAGSGTCIISQVCASLEEQASIAFSLSLAKASLCRLVNHGGATQLLHAPSPLRPRLLLKPLFPCCQTPCPP